MDIHDIKSKETDYVPYEKLKSKIDLLGVVKERLVKERNAFEIRLAKDSVDQKISAAFAHPSTSFMTKAAGKWSILDGPAIGKKGPALKRSDSDKQLMAFMGRSGDDITKINNIQ